MIEGEFIHLVIASVALNRHGQSLPQFLGNSAVFNARTPPVIGHDVLGKHLTRMPSIDIYGAF